MRTTLAACAAAAAFMLATGTAIAHHSFAAESRNVDELLNVGSVIDETCENCHKKYWPNY